MSAAMANDPPVPMLIGLPAELVDLLDAYRNEQGDAPSRQEAIRRILEEALQAPVQLRRTGS
jgi:hypothetical protein